MCSLNMYFCKVIFMQYYFAVALCASGTLAETYEYWLSTYSLLTNVRRTQHLSICTILPQPIYLYVCLCVLVWTKCTENDRSAAHVNSRAIPMQCVCSVLYILPTYSIRLLIARVSTGVCGCEDVQCMANNIFWINSSANEWLPTTNEEKHRIYNELRISNCTEYRDFVPMQKYIFFFQISKLWIENNCSHAKFPHFR